jgi:hypothetical protein
MDRGCLRERASHCHCSETGWWPSEDLLPLYGAGCRPQQVRTVAAVATDSVLCSYATKASSKKLLPLAQVRRLLRQKVWKVSLALQLLYRGADKSLAWPASRCILFDGENISFDASLVMYVNSTNIPPIMIINRMYRGADKSLARPTSRCISFDGENISFDVCLVIYIYIYK